MTSTLSSIKKKLSWLDPKVLATVLLTKLLVLAFGAQAFQILSDQSFAGSYWMCDIWNRWDAESYLHIAESGYTAFGEKRFLIAFFPLYPLLVGLIEKATGSFLMSAFLISGVASIALGLVFRELVKLDHSEKIAQFSVLFLFIFPTSYFLHIPYTESLFLSLSIGCFLAARKKYWIIAGVLGALACLTRINGLILFFALVFEIWNEYRETRKINWEWLGLLLIPSGFIGYLALNYFVTGNPTMFLVHQREHWAKFLTFPWVGIKRAVETTLFQTPNQAQMMGAQELLFVGIGLFATIAGWRYLRNSYRVWMAANWLLFVSTSFILSVPRYTLVMFPLFILMALAAARNWWAQILFTVWSVLYLALFASLFVRGWWAF